MAPIHHHSSRNPVCVDGLCELYPSWALGSGGWGLAGSQECSPGNVLAKNQTPDGEAKRSGSQQITSGSGGSSFAQCSASPWTVEKRKRVMVTQD